MWRLCFDLCQPQAVHLATPLFLLAVGANLASPDPATKVKTVQVVVDAPVGCADANDFFSSLRSRTQLVRRAMGDEPRTTLQVRVLEMRRYVLGELRMADGRGETDTRRVQGANCDDVVQALALAAAVALDPSVLLHAPDTVPAPETTTPANPPPAIAPAVVESVEVRKPTDSPPSSAPRLEPHFELGAASVGSLFLSSGISPGVAVFGRWTPAGHGKLRPTLGVAVTYLRNDVLESPGAVQASLTGLVASACAVG